MQILPCWEQQFRSGRLIGEIYSQIAIEVGGCDHMQCQEDAVPFEGNDCPNRGGPLVGPNTKVTARDNTVQVADATLQIKEMPVMPKGRSQNQKSGREKRVQFWELLSQELGDSPYPKNHWAHFLGGKLCQGKEE